ncbi:MAG: hypothetical protein GX957_15900, partial [Clostridiaceae bacterium]|nr:hypothetical protein [Clostridiaceae bacterium]
VDNGAVISGHVDLMYVDNVTIKGSGIIMRDEESVGDGCVITAYGCKNINISGIIGNVHRKTEWTTNIRYSSNVNIDNYKTVSPEWASTDGIDIVNCQNVNINDCFLRATDDTITIKGISDDTEEMGAAPPNENIKVTNCILWNECNSAMVVGEESAARYYKNITFDNIDVLFSYDDIYYHESLYERAVISIIPLYGGILEDITWNNIRVNECERLICFAFVDEFYKQPVDEFKCQALPGYIKNVTVKNVTSNSTSTGLYANQIYLKGWDSEKPITDITFENIVINGEKLNADSPLIVKNEFVYNFTVK